jgi:hypothetical protein
VKIDGGQLEAKPPIAMAKPADSSVLQRVNLAF